MRLTQNAIELNGHKKRLNLTFVRPVVRRFLVLALLRGFLVEIRVFQDSLHGSHLILDFGTLPDGPLEPAQQRQRVGDGKTHETAVQRLRQPHAQQTDARDED